MTSVDEPFAQRLDAFLAARGATRGALLATVGEPFGPPLLVVAAGSILHGFGNQRSDIDVNVVTARELGMTAIHFVDTAQAIADISAALDS